MRVGEVKFSSASHDSTLRHQGRPYFLLSGFRLSMQGPGPSAQSVKWCLTLQMISQALWEAKALKCVSFHRLKVLIVQSSLASVRELACLQIVCGACTRRQAISYHC